MDITFAQIEPLIHRTRRHGRTVSVVFACPVTGFRVTASGSLEVGLVKGMAQETAATAKNVAAHTARTTLARSLGQMVGGGFLGQVASTAAYRATPRALANPSAGRQVVDEQDVRHAIVRAFQSVAEQFRWVPDQQRFVSATAPKVQLTSGQIGEPPAPPAEPEEVPEVRAARSAPAGVMPSRRPSAGVSPMVARAQAHESTSTMGVRRPWTVTPPATRQAAGRPSPLDPSRSATSVTATAATTTPSDAPSTAAPARTIEDPWDQLRAAPWGGSENLQLISRMLWEIARSHAGVGDAEQALIDSLGEAGLLDADALVSGGPLAAAAFELVPDGLREPMLLLAQTMAWADGHVAFPERQRVEMYRNWLGISSRRAAELDRAARAQVLRVHAHHTDDPVSIEQMAGRLGLRDDEVEVALRVDY